MNFSDKVQCQMCKGIESRGNTLILETPKGRFRLCRNCYSVYAKRQLNDGYKEAKKNVELFNISGTDAYEVIKNQEKFIKDIKEGKLNVRP